MIRSVNSPIVSAEVRTDLSHVDAALSDLYRQAAAGAEAQAAPVFRALLANVVVYACSDEEADGSAATIAQVSGTHPSRAVVLRAVPPGQEVPSAAVSAVCDITERGERTLCGEIVRFGVSSDSETLPLVMPLLLPDVPIFVWAPCDLHIADRGFNGLVRYADYVLLDSRRFRDLDAGLETIASGMSGPAVTDLAWVSILMWREFTARHFDPPMFRRYLDDLVEIEVAFAPGGQDSRMPIAPLLFASWLIERLGLTVDHVSLGADNGGAVESSREGRPVRITLTPGESDGEPGAILSTSIRCRAGDIMATFITTTSTGEDAPSAAQTCIIVPVPPQVIELPAEPESALLAQALASPGRDTFYERALGIARDLLHHPS